MADDDRAAKAARAKAMLKKRQQKGKGTGPSLLSEGSIPSSSRPSSPAPPSEVIPKVDQANNAELNDVFADNGDSTWMTSLPPVKSPLSPPPHASPKEPEDVPNTGDTSEALRAQLSHQEQVIRALEAKQHASESALKRMEENIQQHQRTEELLAEERNRTHDLQSHLRKMEKDVQDTATQLKEATERERLQALSSHEHSFNQQQAISLLVAEKTSLTTSLERLEDLESQMTEKDERLAYELSRSQTLDQRLQEAERGLQDSRSKLDQWKELESVLSDKCREQERQLQLLNGTVDDLRTEAERHQRHARELELKIQSDDRVDKLLESLKKTQDRAEELEFQLTKLKQSHSALKTERDNFDQQLRSTQETVDEWGQKHSSLQATHSSISVELAAAVSARDTISREKDALASQLHLSEENLKSAHRNLSVAATELQARAKQLQDAENEARLAIRRANDAERTQKELQAEGTALMQSLNEMRPKIVELTGTKIELGERIEHLEHTLRKRDGVIADLENTVEELEAQKAEMASSGGEAAAIQAKELQNSRKQLAEMHSAHADLQTEYQTIRSKVEALEVELSSQREITLRQLREIEHAAQSADSLAAELMEARKEMEDQSQFRDEAEPFLERAQEEIEELRAQLSAAEEQLRQTETPLVSNGLGQSLDGEMLSALKQQHALDQSTSSSKIRALDTALFDAQAESHALQLRVALLEEELSRSHSRSSSRTAYHPKHSGKRGHQEPSKPSISSPLSRSVFDIGLSPETRHKRKVSLSMLKARIDSEMSTMTRTVSKPGLSRTQSTLSSVAESGDTSLQARRRRQHISDETHFHWCASCSGDLIIL